MLVLPKVPVFLLVIYYLPDHPLILERYHWQTVDEVPKLPRITNFLEYWRTNLDGVINSIFVDAGKEVGPMRFRHVDQLYQLN
jgi:uncharacterized protein Usg